MMLSLHQRYYDDLSFMLRQFRQLQHSAALGGACGDGAPCETNAVHFILGSAYLQIYRSLPLYFLVRRGGARVWCGVCHAVCVCVRARGFVRGCRGGSRSVVPCGDALRIGRLHGLAAARDGAR